jgi:hypothetical protein
MKKEQKTLEQQVKEMKVRMDLLFSVISNDYLSKQAMQVFQSVGEGLKENPDNKELKEVSEKSLESYKYHGENVNDAVSYYYELFGEEANLDVFGLMKEKGIDRKFENFDEDVEKMKGKEAPEPEPIAKVGAKGSKSRKKDKK